MYYIGETLSKRASYAKYDANEALNSGPVTVKWADPLTGERIPNFHFTRHIGAKEIEEADLWFRKAAEAAHVKSLSSEKDLGQYLSQVYAAGQ